MIFRENWLNAAICAAGAMALAPAFASGQTVLFDSEGFESPDFVAGDLVGQEGFTSFATGGGGNSTATVGSGTGFEVASGSQSVELFRDGADGGGATGFFVDLTPATHDRFVFVEFDLFVETAPNIAVPPDASFGPGFGIDVFTNQGRVAGVGVDASDGAFFTATSNFPAANSFSGPGIVEFGAFQSWEIILDFEAEVFFVLIDDEAITPSGGVAFLADIDFAGGDEFTDASIVLGPTDASFLDAFGTAFIDNYVVSTDIVIPEPGSAAVLAAACVIGVTRRRRQTTA